MIGITNSEKKANKCFVEQMAKLSYYTGYGHTPNSPSKERFAKGEYPMIPGISTYNDSHTLSCDVRAPFYLYSSNAARQAQKEYKVFLNAINVAATKGKATLNYAMLQHGWATMLTDEHVKDQLSAQSDIYVFIAPRAGTMHIRHIRMSDIPYISKCVDLYLAMDSANCEAAVYTALRSHYTSYQIQNMSNVNQSIIARLRKGSRKIPRISAQSAVQLQHFVRKYKLNEPKEFWSIHWLMPYLRSI